MACLFVTSVTTAVSFYCSLSLLGLAFGWFLFACCINMLSTVLLLLYFFVHVHIPDWQYRCHMSRDGNDIDTPSPNLVEACEIWELNMTLRLTLLSLLYRLQIPSIDIYYLALSYELTR
jgi:hypothetical protein